MAEIPPEGSICHTHAPRSGRIAAGRDRYRACPRDASASYISLENHRGKPAAFVRDSNGCVQACVLPKSYSRRAAN
ncbi:hypothetical protein EVAR_55717_1 [Eumeta japonica]|uniref:Uncharacterized protein n=1 Tax=Eumeta variegata TaxID=151549 RepID=A0A4C1YXL1_EUMVA|nr:hypothetical protein EVAR_55717_1 [Eumeta japonica]